MGLGWSQLHENRKRGAFWLANDETNPMFQVFSYGALTFPLGAMVLAWGLSNP